jgi:hypothetical protein
MNDSIEEGWQVVSRNKKTAVPTTSSYIPPHLRDKAPSAPLMTKTVNLDSADDFPSLGGSKPKPSPGSAWGSKTTFTQKINELIAFEQRTEAEKVEAMEAAKELDGYAVLNLKFDRARYIAFNEKMAAAEKDVARLEDAYTRQMYSYVCHCRNEEDETDSVDYDGESVDYEND